jgi:uncharacterized membrane protein YoaK (UPF0700 family)
MIANGARTANVAAMVVAEVSSSTWGAERASGQMRFFSLCTPYFLVDPSVSPAADGVLAAMTDEEPAPARRLLLRRALRRALVDDRDGPLPAMLLALTVLAGVVDATSILALDHVFVAAMTGNIVFIGLGLAGATGFSVASPGVALVSFVVGVLAGARICRRSGGHRGRALRNVTIFKTVLATPVTVTVLLVGDHLATGVRIFVTVLLAASMGAQLALIRYLKVPDLLTAVLTLTMTGVLTERGAGRHDPTVLRRGLALLAFAVGVVAGGLLVGLVSVGAALVLGLAIILAVGVATHLVSRTSASWSAPR